MLNQWFSNYNWISPKRKSHSILATLILINFSKVAGAEIPSWIINRLKIYRDDKESLQAFGQEVVSEMCLKLKTGGVKDFHFYSMNRTEPVLSIVQNII